MCSWHMWGSASEDRPTYPIPCLTPLPPLTPLRKGPAVLQEGHDVEEVAAVEDVEQGQDLRPRRRPRPRRGRERTATAGSGSTAKQRGGTGSEDEAGEGEKRDGARRQQGGARHSVPGKRLAGSATGRAQACCELLVDRQLPGRVYIDTDAASRHGPWLTSTTRCGATAGPLVHGRRWRQVGLEFEFHNSCNTCARFHPPGGCP